MLLCQDTRSKATHMQIEGNKNIIGKEEGASESKAEWDLHYKMADSRTDKERS